METIIAQRKLVEQALKTLAKSLKLLDDSTYQMLHDELRDSLIKRFEYSIDSFWKYLKIYLEAMHKITIGPVISPKSVFRSALNIKVINEDEFEELLLAVDDRNLTSHTYKKELAEEISIRIRGYYLLMKSILERNS